MENPSSGFMLKAVEERWGEERRGDREREESVVEEEVKWASIETNTQTPSHSKHSTLSLGLGFVASM